LNKVSGSEVMWNGLLQSYDFVLKQVGNFRVEPPGLFRGRGDHPKVQSSFHFFICFLVLLFPCKYQCSLG
jgi:hypothetical protein